MIEGVITVDKLLWKLLVWIWARRAQKQYGGPGDKGELFNTASFTSAVRETTVKDIDVQSAITWLVRNGYFRGRGGSHWYDNEAKAYDSYPESPALR